MGRHKQMPGRTYEVIYQNNSEAIVNCTYLCPYCNQETVVQMTVQSENFHYLETGGFYEPLKCNLCNNISDVRFLKGNRI